MIESVISLLIYIVVLALVVYLILWVVRDILGLPIPEKVVQLIWVIVVLIVILMIVRILPLKLAVLDGNGNPTFAARFEAVADASR